MNKNSRSKNSMKNSIVGLINQFIILALSFVSRTIFIKLLGAEYLGINGLYSNILSVLSLAELGVGNVMIYSLYKPIAEDDKKRICTLLNYYKKIYRIIAFSILGIGLALIPFLDLIVKSSLSEGKLIFYYVMFLVNSVVSYFVIFKSALINADQKVYILNTNRTIFILLQNVLQIIVLLITQNYILYLSMQILCTILSNLFINFKANKLYPFILDKKNISKEKMDYSEINKNIKSMFLYKIATVILNNTDNILISIILGTIYVGYYSNYSMIIVTINTFISIITQALIASLGNLNANNDMEKSYKIFKTLIFFFNGVTGFCVVCLTIGFNDLITIWLGKNFVLNNAVLGAIIINFWMNNIINPVWMYRETMGLFNQMKYIMFITALINLILSIILGKSIGLAGILIATAISKILTMVWYEPNILYKTRFNKKVSEYFFTQGKYILLTTISLLVSKYLCRNICGGFISLMIKIVISGSIFLTIFVICTFKSDEFKKIFGYINIKNKR